ncbi:MAG: signal peptidase I [Candidatus Sulfotelmatobacter sp.]
MLGSGSNEAVPERDTPALPPANLKQHLAAVVLSTLVPGLGQLVLCRRRKAFILFALLAAIIIGFCIFRLPRSFPGMLLLLWATLLSSVYAVYDALLTRNRSRALSKWWLLAGIPLTYISVNLVFTSLFLASGFRALRYASTAMEPTLLQRDKFVYDVRAFHRRRESRDDLVVECLEDGFTVKRVIAIPGDTIEGKSRQIFLNGKVLDEPFVQHVRPIGDNEQLDTFGPVTVPARKYFVMGDNRDISRDSRLQDFGMVDSEQIVGKPLYVYRIIEKGKVWQVLR